MDGTSNRKNAILISVFIFLLIILASALLIEMQKVATTQKPYVIGSPIVPATDMPLGMMLMAFNVPASEPVPTIALNVLPDTLGGFDVHVTTTNFTFTPEHINQAPVAGQGHVHLYIDNNLIIMLGPWYHIDSLAPGSHTIRVGLFNNDHSAYTINNLHIEAQTQIYEK